MTRGLLLSFLADPGLNIILIGAPRTGRMKIVSQQVTRSIQTHLTFPISTLFLKADLAVMGMAAFLTIRAAQSDTAKALE